MNDRDYFAMHAPMSIPDWFKGEYSGDMPRIPDAPSHWGAAEAAQLSDLKAGIGFVSTARQEVAEFFALYLAARDKQNAWRDRQRERKYFAWRWYYADMMIAARKP